MVENVRLRCEEEDWNTDYECHWKGVFSARLDVTFEVEGEEQEKVYETKQKSQRNTRRNTHTQIEQFATLFVCMCVCFFPAVPLTVESSNILVEWPRTRRLAKSVV